LATLENFLGVATALFLQAQRMTVDDLGAAFAAGQEKEIRR